MAAGYRLSPPKADQLELSPRGIPPGRGPLLSRRYGATHHRHNNRWIGVGICYENTVVNTSDRSPHRRSTYSCNQLRQLLRPPTGRLAGEVMMPSTTSWKLC